MGWASLFPCYKDERGGIKERKEGEGRECGGIYAMAHEGILEIFVAIK